MVQKVACANRLNRSSGPTYHTPARYTRPTARAIQVESDSEARRLGRTEKIPPLPARREGVRRTGSDPREHKDDATSVNRRSGGLLEKAPQPAGKGSRRGVGLRVGPTYLKRRKVDIIFGPCRRKPLSLSLTWPCSNPCPVKTG